jgi:hypothetical protein
VDAAYAAGVSRSASGHSNVLQELQRQPSQQQRQQQQRGVKKKVARQQQQQQLAGSAAAGSKGKQQLENLQQQQQQQHDVAEPAAEAALLQPVAGSGCSTEASGAADAADAADTADAVRTAASTALAGVGGSCAAEGAFAGDGDSSSGSSVLMSVLPGDVVWVSAKGSPPWPVLVITSEEATDFSIPHGHTRVPQVRPQRASNQLLVCLPGRQHACYM